MKVSQQNTGSDIPEQKGPRIGHHMNDVDKGRELIEEKPDGPDKRLVAGAAVLFLITLVIGIKGSITNSSLSSKLAEQQSIYDKAHTEALALGIVEDEDGELIVPEVKDPVNVSDLTWDSVESRNDELLKSFTKEILNYSSLDEYNKTRQTLMDTWGFREDSVLLTTFMPEADGDVGSISFNPDTGMKKFVLENDGKKLSYFLICEVYNTVKTENGKSSATGEVGVKLTINEDGTMSNVSVQTLARKTPKK